MTGVLMRKAKDTQREGPVTAEAKIEVTGQQAWEQQGSTAGPWRLDEAGKESTQSRRARGPALTLTSDLRPPEP